MDLAIEAIQKKIDTGYPETCIFDVKSLRPKGTLVERLKIFDAVAPRFFEEGKRILDIGCARGFFSLLAHRRQLSEGDDKVSPGVAIDINPEFVADATKLAEGLPIRFVCSSFQDFLLGGGCFDRIFIGNGPHYMFRGCGFHHDWLAKLSVLSTDLVLMEGGFDFGDPELHSLVNGPGPVSRFSFSAFEKAVSQHFDILAHVSSHIKGRDVVLLKKKTDLTLREVQLNKLEFIKVFSMGFRTLQTYFLSSIDGREVYCKLYGQGFKVGEARLASKSPYSTDILACIRHGDVLAGWAEEKCDEEILTMTPEVARVACKHQLFLLRNGVLDIDLATINYMRLNGRVVNVDKNQVYASSIFQQSHYDGAVYRWGQELRAFEGLLPALVTDERLRQVFHSGLKGMRVYFEELLTALEAL